MLVPIPGKPHAEVDFASGLFIASWCGDSRLAKDSKMAGRVFVIGVDVGGTNTDAVVFSDNKVVAAAKCPTEENRANGVINAIRASLDNLPPSLERSEVVRNVVRVCIGTTHFVNAVESRDLSSLARVAVVRLCGSASRALIPFCDFPDDLREIMCGGVYMVSGGFEYNHQPISALERQELEKVAQKIRCSQPPVDNVVVSCVFSPHDDPQSNQEQVAAHILQQECPGCTYTLSHKVFTNTKILLLEHFLS